MRSVPDLRNATVRIVTPTQPLVGHLTPQLNWASFYAKRLWAPGHLVQNAFQEIGTDVLNVNQQLHKNVLLYLPAILEQKVHKDDAESEVPPVSYVVAAIIGSEADRTETVERLAQLRMGGELITDTDASNVCEHLRCVFRQVFTERVHAQQVPLPFHPVFAIEELRFWVLHPRRHENARFTDAEIARIVQIHRMILHTHLSPLFFKMFRFAALDLEAADDRLREIFPRERIAALQMMRPALQP